MPNDDLTLLREFVRTGSELIFAAMVERHVNLVYSVALRQVRDTHLAEEITQAVFIILARKAGSLGGQVILSGWLCRVARHVSARAVRTRLRRQRREQEAYMQSTLNDPEPDAWAHIAPLLDDAMEKLGRADHDALVLRFFENKTFAEVGAVLDATEAAAKMRVGRALEKLRQLLTRRGVNCTADAISHAIAANSIQIAPVALAKTISAVALAKGAAASTSTSTLLKGALKIMAWTKSQTATAATVVLVLATGVAVVAVKRGPEHARAVSQTQSDVTALQGTWTGRETGAAGESTLTFEGANLEFHGANPNEWYKATFTLREDTSPKQLIAVITDCHAPQYVGKTSYAIYQLEGGTMTFVGNEPGKPNPPAGFDAAGGRTFVFTKR